MYFLSDVQFGTLGQVQSVVLLEEKGGVINLDSNKLRPTTSAIQEFRKFGLIYLEGIEANATTLKSSPSRHDISGLQTALVVSYQWPLTN